MLRVSDIKQAIKSGEASLNNTTKTSKPRLLLFTRAARDILADLFEDMLENYNDDDYIFHTPRNRKKPLNSISWTISFNKVIQSALGPLYASHGFRRGYITSFARKGIHPKIASACVGHNSVSTTLLYFNPSQEDVRSAIDKVR